MNELATEWVFKAEEDFYSAESLLHAIERPMASTSCFHSQQCAEKYLKAFLQEHNVRFERKHELLPLVELSVELDADFAGLRDDLERLDGYSVAVRYPGITPSLKLAEAALDAAKRVRSFVRMKLQI